MFGEFGQFLFVFQYLARKFLVRNSCQMSYSELRFPNLSCSNPIETNIDTKKEVQENTIKPGKGNA